MEQLSYHTVAQPATAELTIERSRFIGHCQEVSTESAAKEFVNRIRTLHAQANHNCYAFRIGSGENPLTYYNDHGEPSGTAGKPILGAIERLGLTHTVVVVTRYFGGKKLGVRGLIEAYGHTATLVLEQAGVVVRIPKFTVNLTYAYADHSLILYKMAQIGAEVVESQFTATIATTFTLPESNRAVCDALLRELPLLSQ